MNSYYSSVNGPSCHYRKLAKYSKCSEAEVTAVAAPSVVDYTFKDSAAIDKAGFATPSPTAPVAAAPATTPEPFAYRSKERFETVTPEYTPSYSVPNYPAINIDSLLYGGKGCNGHPTIIDAYGGSSAGSCTTNFINN